MGRRYVRDGASDEVEAPSTGLALTLERLGLPLARLKTGTPPRLDGGTIAWEDPALMVQPSEDRARNAFSFEHEQHGQHGQSPQSPLRRAPRLVDCYRGATNAATHAIVARNRHRLPAYDSGGGAGAGPRYCPSLHVKVERFPTRDEHVVWLEPEGLDTTTVYPNGISGAFDPEVQREIVRSIRGLEAAEIVRPGYDVEYDFVAPGGGCLTHALETVARPACPLTVPSSGIPPLPLWGWHGWPWAATSLSLAELPCRSGPPREARAPTRTRGTGTRTRAGQSGRRLSGCLTTPRRAAASTWRGRSSAPRATRRRRALASSPASTRRSREGMGSRPLCSGGTRRTLACWSTTW